MSAIFRWSLLSGGRKDRFDCTTTGHTSGILSIATEMVSAPPVRGKLQGDQQVSSTILMYTEKRGRRTILVAIESMPVNSRSAYQAYVYGLLEKSYWHR